MAAEERAAQLLAAADTDPAVKVRIGNARRDFLARQAGAVAASLLGLGLFHLKWPLRLRANRWKSLGALAGVIALNAAADLRWRGEYLAAIGQAAGL